MKLGLVIEWRLLVQNVNTWNILRLFLAARLPSDPEILKRSLADWSSRAPEWKWVDSSHLHLTFKFLGETPADRLGSLEGAAAAAVAGLPAFTAELKGLRAFPEPEHPAVVWLRI